MQFVWEWIHSLDIKMIYKASVRRNAFICIIYVLRLPISLKTYMAIERDK